MATISYNAFKPTSAIPAICKYKLLIYSIAIISAVCVIISTIILYSHFDTITPGGNRVQGETHEGFGLTSFPIYLILLSIGAMAALYFPIYKLYHSNNPQNFKYGIFPASKSYHRIVSVLLSFLNIGSGLLFTICFALITWVYVYSDNPNRILIDDETFLLYLAYISCIVFWGYIDLIYMIKYKNNW